MQLKTIVLANLITYKTKKQISPGVFSYIFTIDKPFEWKAGQHALLSLRTKDGKRVRRAFSISSAPTENIITITLRMPADDLTPFKQALKALKKGDKVRMRGPVGPLFIDDPALQYAFLATGIGITPFRPILLEAAANKTPSQITLFFAGNKENHFFREELSELNKKMPNLSIKYIYYPERLTGEVIQDTLGDNTMQTIFLLSGSTKMISSYRRTLSGLGIERKNIKSDRFIGIKPPENIKNPLAK